MNKKSRAKIIKELLDHYFPEPPIPLNHSSPYTLLIAVLLSAQCTDERVNKVTPELFELADTPEEMAKLDYELIRSIIRTCGLSERKAKAIKDLSIILVEKHAGRVPETFEELEELPGVGHKTASVVMAQAFSQAAFPVDTHIHRLAKRWKLSNGKSVEKTEEDLKKVFDKNDWTRLHLQIIYYARRYCPALRHDVAKCPICQRLAQQESSTMR